MKNMLSMFVNSKKRKEVKNLLEANPEKILRKYKDYENLLTQKQKNELVLILEEKNPWLLKKNYEKLKDELKIDIRKKVESVLSRYKKKEEELKKGFGIEKEPTEYEKRVARFLHESNLIESIPEMSESEILEKLRNKNDNTGHAGAYKFMKEKANAQKPLTSTDILEMQKRITEEQVLLGHDLDPKHRGHLRRELEFKEIKDLSEAAGKPVYERGGKRFIVVQEPELVSIGGKIVDPISKEKFEAFAEELNNELILLGDTPNIDFVLRKAAQLHLKFETMHPFMDGNGRTGRLLINYMLEYFGYDPLVVTENDKMKYYKGFINQGTPKESSLIMEEYFLWKHEDSFLKRNRKNLYRS